MRSKPQNACLYKPALSPRLLRFQNSKVVHVAFSTMRNSLFYEGSRLNLKTTPRKYGFWNELYRLMMWYLRHLISVGILKSQLEILSFDQWPVWYMFRWHTRQTDGITGTSEDHDLKTSTSESCMCNQAQQKKRSFSAAFCKSMAPLNNDSTKFSNLTVP